MINPVTFHYTDPVAFPDIDEFITQVEAVTGIQRENLVCVKYSNVVR